MTRYRVSMDIGGTFTDVVAYDEATAKYTVGKASTTPHDLTEGVMAGLSQVVQTPKDISFTVHGTTQGINAFLQRRGVRVMLLATAGAGHVYHIARGNRARLYDIHYRKPEPLVPLSDIVEINGRLRSDGVEREPLDETGIRAAANRFRAEGFGSIAVAFLFSYVNSAHEVRAEQILREELGPDVQITLSHRVAREWREYERTSSAVLDAYTGPIIRRYLERLESEMQDQQLGVPLHVMQSSGGIVTARSARDLPLQTLLSGPVGGTMGGVALARLLDRPNLICVDMGGTSFDVSLIHDGHPDVTNEADLEGFPILMPVVSIHTIGAGGGSIAYTEAGGLRVGPESAGATPGPACYGRGGSRPTVTDANLVLGRIDPSWFAGGTMSLDRALAADVVDHLGTDLGLSTEVMAEGICDVANAKMAQAIRNITVEKGIEPREFSLVAFGGAGPMHAVFLARELEIDEVIVPSFPGAFSAWGMLETELRRDLSQSHYLAFDRVDLADLAQRLQSMEAEAVAAVEHEGARSDVIRTQHAVDIRYVAQEYTVTVPILFAAEPLEAGFRETLPERFHEAHRARYGHSNPGAPIEIVTLRTTAVGDLGRPIPKPAELRPESPFLFDTRDVVFDGAPRATKFIRRRDLAAGVTVEGPAVVVEQTATTVIPPGAQLRVDQIGALIVNVGRGS